MVENKMEAQVRTKVWLSSHRLPGKFEVALDLSEESLRWNTYLSSEKTPPPSNLGQATLGKLDLR